MRAGRAIPQTGQGPGRPGPETMIDFFRTTRPRRSGRPPSSVPRPWAVPRAAVPTPRRPLAPPPCGRSARSRPSGSDRYWRSCPRRRRPRCARPRHSTGAGRSFPIPRRPRRPAPAPTPSSPSRRARRRASRASRCSPIRRAPCSRPWRSPPSPVRLPDGRASPGSPRPRRVLPRPASPPPSAPARPTGRAKQGPGLRYPWQL